MSGIAFLYHFGKGIMKRIITLAALLVCLTSSAQRLTVHNQSSISEQEAIPDSIFNQQLFEAGQYMNKAAGFGTISMGCAIASGMSFTMIKDKDTRNLVGCAFALAATISEIYAITYRKKSGMKLMIAAGYASLTF